MTELVDRSEALLADLARDMLKLQEHPEWETLRRKFAETQALYEQRTAREMLAGGEGASPVDQRKVDFRRGYLRACEDLFEYPERIVARFNKENERKQSSG